MFSTSGSSRIARLAFTFMNTPPEQAIRPIPVSRTAPATQRVSIRLDESLGAGGHPIEALPFEQTSQEFVRRIHRRHALLSPPAEAIRGELEQPFEATRATSRASREFAP